MGRRQKDVDRPTLAGRPLIGDAWHDERSHVFVHLEVTHLEQIVEPASAKPSPFRARRWPSRASR
jgi:hypothetical protein